MLPFAIDPSGPPLDLLPGMAVDRMPDRVRLFVFTGVTGALGERRWPGLCQVALDSGYTGARSPW